MPVLSNLTPVSYSYLVFARLETITQMARSCWSVAAQTCRQPDSCRDVFSPPGRKLQYHFIQSDVKKWSPKTTLCFAVCDGGPIPRAPGKQRAAGEPASCCPQRGVCTSRLQSATAPKHLPRQPGTGLLLLSHKQRHAALCCNKSVSADAIKN